MSTGLAIIAVPIAILCNLGAANLFMMVDDGSAACRVDSPTWRIASSAAPIVIVEGRAVDGSDPAIWDRVIGHA